MAKQNILITGASNGFGELMVKSLVDKGHTVIASMRAAQGRNAGKAQSLTEYASGKSGAVHIVELDVDNDASVRSGVEAALKAAGSIDVLVNNAGFGAAGIAEASTPEQWQKIFETNVFGVQRVNRAVLPSMRQRGSGLIVYISSVMGRIVIPFAAAYTASKWALEALAENYRYELAMTGIDNVIVEPGGFGTGFFAAMQQSDDPARLDSYGELAKVPEQVFGGFAKSLQGENAPNPQDVADAVVRLVETPAGKRPLRTVVDPMTGGEAPSAVNATSNQVQEQLLTGFEMGDFLSVKGG